MMKKTLLFLYFLLLLSIVCSAELKGFLSMGSPIEEEFFPEENKMVYSFTSPKKIIVSNIFVSSPSAEIKYYLKIPENVQMEICDERMPECSFSSDNTQLSVNSTISGLILENNSRIALYHHIFPSSFDFIVEGDINVNGSASIDASGLDGGNSDVCNGLPAGNGKNAGNIQVNGSIFLLENSSLTVFSDGGSGGNGSDGSYECSVLDGTNGGSPGKAGNITVNNLVFSENSSGVFSVNAGNGGNAGQGEYFVETIGNEDEVEECENEYDSCKDNCKTACGWTWDNPYVLPSCVEPCEESCKQQRDTCLENVSENITNIYEGEDGQQGLSESAGRIEVNNFSAQLNSKISFFALKGTGKNFELFSDGNISMKSCSNSGLEFDSVKAGRIFVYSNNLLDLMNSFNSVCIKPDCSTFFQPKINFDCPAEIQENNNAIFSLTGTIKKNEENLSGKFSEFVLFKDSGNLIEVDRTLPSQDFAFSDGFFNFSFGFNQSIFSLTEFDFSSESNPFSYVLNFVVNAFDPVLSDVIKAGFVLEEFEE